MGSILNTAICPRCRGPLDRDAACALCGQTYPRLASVRVLLPDASLHLELWRRQLGLVLNHASETIRVLALQASAPDLGGTTRLRLQALARSIADQADDVAQIL